MKQLSLPHVLQGGFIKLHIADMFIPKCVTATVAADNRHQKYCCTKDVAKEREKSVLKMTHRLSRGNYILGDAFELI